MWVEHGLYERRTIYENHKMGHNENHRFRLVMHSEMETSEITLIEKKVQEEWDQIVIAAHARSLHK